MLKQTFLAAAFVAFLVAPASAAEFVLDKNHTQAEFVVPHLTITKVRGTVPLISGGCQIAANQLPTDCNATFDMKGLDTHFERRDTDVRDNYLDVAHFPTMTFTQRRVEGTPQSFKLIGDLTVHGVTKPITLTGKLDGDMMVTSRTAGAKRNIAYHATGTFDRRDFGITFAPVADNQLFVGYEVQIELQAYAVEK